MNVIGKELHVQGLLNAWWALVFLWPLPAYFIAFAAGESWLLQLHDGATAQQAQCEHAACGHLVR